MLSTQRPDDAKGGSVFEHYEQVGELGRGNFSTVVKAKPKKTPSPYGYDLFAVKTCPMEDRQKVEVLRKEWAALKEARHPHVIGAFEYFENETEASMVMEYAPHGSLMSWVESEIEGITERQVCVVMEQVLSAVDFLHQNGYAHRDVKPHNILVYTLAPLTIRLADFGLAKQCASTRLFGRQCTGGDFEIMSPEMRDNVEQRCPATEEEYQKNDIYACGVTMYWLLSGHAPYPPAIDCRFQPDYPWMYPESRTFPQVSPEGVGVVRKLMATYLDERPDAQEALNFDWFALSRQISSHSTMGGRQPSATPSSTPSTQDPNRSPPVTGLQNTSLLSSIGSSPLLCRHETISEQDFNCNPSNESMASQRQRSTATACSFAGDAAKPVATGAE